MAALSALSAAIHGAFEFEPGSTTAASPVDHILETGRGVCQDYAHVMIAIVRSWGIPARYVSGYLYLADDQGRPISQTAMHAWVECCLPDQRWIGFDPTNDTPIGEDYVRVAVGRDYGDVAPTAGIYQGSGLSRLDVAIDITRAASAARGDSD